MPAPMTTSRSRLASPSSMPGCAPRCGGRSGLQRPETRSASVRWLLSTARHRVEVDGTEVNLTPREYELLKVLLAHAGRVASRARLLRAVWGAEYSTENHYLHVHVAAIRRKLAAVDPDGVLRRLIVAEPGVGYRVHDAEELARRRNLSAS